MKANSAFAKIRAALAYQRLRASLAASRIAASISASRLAVSVRASLLSATANFTQLAARAQYSILAVTNTALGEWVKFFRFFNAINLTERLTRQFSKVKSDTASATELAAKATSKTRSDAGNARDTSSRAVGKAKTDQVGAADVSTKSYTKAPVELPIASDGIDYKALERALSNATSIFDAIGIVTTFRRFFADESSALDSSSKSTEKVRADTTTAADDPLRSFTKGVADEPEALDETVREFLKALRDTVMPTDDVDAATVDDEQNMNLSRFRSELIGAGDVLQRTVEYLRSFADQSVTQDFASRDVAKNPTDSTSTEEQTAFDTSKLKADEAIIYEQMVRAMFRPRSYADEASALDAKAVTSSKTRADAAQADDVSEKSFDKGAANSAITSDEFSRIVEYVRSIADDPTADDLLAISTAKSFADVSAATDAAARHLIKSVIDSVLVDDAAELGGRGNYAATERPAVFDLVLNHLAKAVASSVATSDVYVRSMIKGLSDVPITMEHRAREFSKIKSELVSTSDSGLVRSQNYCDMDYIAGDYVGVSRTI